MKANQSHAAAQQLSWFCFAVMARLFFKNSKSRINVVGGKRRKAHRATSNR